MNIDEAQVLDVSTERDNNALKPSVSLIKEGNDLSAQIVAAKTPDEVNDLMSQFVMLQKKKNMVRASKLASLQEIIDDEVIMRMSSTPEAFDNADLLKYFDTTQKAVANLEQLIDRQPAVQINTQKNEININQNVDLGLNRESRSKVLDAVSKILENIDSFDFTDTEDSDIIDTSYSEEE